VRAAVATAKLLGDGLYGVDLKERDSGVFVIEINDNPNMDLGAEDAMLGDELYRKVLGHLLMRHERREGLPAASAPVTQTTQTFSAISGGAARLSKQGKASKSANATKSIIGRSAGGQLASTVVVARSVEAHCGHVSASIRILYTIGRAHCTIFIFASVK
jgi:hypothetical protein